jgi:cyclase
VEEIVPGSNIFVSTEFRQINVGAVLTDEGWILIDVPPYPDDARRWRAQLSQRGPGVVLYVINTDHHRDRIIGNHWFKGYVVAHRHTADVVRALPSQFVEQAVDSLSRNDMERATFNGVKLRPPDVSFSKRLHIKQGGREVLLLSMPGPTPGSTWVHFPEYRVVFTGDSVVVGMHPFMAAADSKSWLDTLTNLRRARFAADILVPGRGPMTDKDSTVPVSDYVRMARRRVYNLYRAGRPRADTATLMSDFIEVFPLSEPYEDVQKQIKSGLDHIYEEYKAAEIARNQAKDRS